LGGIGLLVDIDGGVESGFVFVHQVAHNDGVEPIETQLSIPASVDVDEVCGFTRTMFGRTIFLAGASVCRALALPKSCAFEVKIVDDRRALLRILEADVAENEKSHGDRKKSFMYADSLSCAENSSVDLALTISSQLAISWAFLLREIGRQLLLASSVLSAFTAKVSVIIYRFVFF
jgi:hypothetical protein